MPETTTKYSIIFDYALAKLKDYDLVKFSQERVYSILTDYLQAACVKFGACRQNLSNRDDMLGVFNIALTGDEIEILSNELVREYLSATYIKTPLLLKPTMSSKDFNTFSNANHLNSLMSLDRTLREDNEQLISMYSWFDSELYAEDETGVAT